jgi:predicted RNase H-like HicB family nuclease
LRELRGLMKGPLTTEAPVEFEISFDHEEDGRWIAEAVELPGVLAYGATLEEARAKAPALATELIAEQAKKI